ncbi:MULTISPECIES: CHAD domain-containing protein [Streptomyces]|uniref:CHAD domain-containing protein n=1 Tax=Streptomyces siderophoricus TaxID=2802281 RepID=A0ABS1MW77_9ACTN|nr:CHAD domain-containing protein [Streptomyces sp. 9-7]MBL1091980.1 CHAD domain-containing protein [Streptomyces sp. 9-7]
MAQRPDQRTGGPAGLLGTGCEPGGAAGARAAVVDGPYGPYGPPGPYDDPAAGTGPAAGPHLAGRTAEDVLAGYLHQQSADFLRSLRLHRESGPDAEGAGAAARRLRRAARRISATLHTFRPLTEEAWADQLLAELGWLSGTLAREQACAARRDRLMAALTRLTGRTDRPDRPERSTDRAPRTGRGGRTDRGAAPAAGTRSMGARTAGAPRKTEASGTDSGPGSPGPDTDTGSLEGRDTAVPDADAVLAAGAARAGALLDRQLTLARTRAHSAALQALGSSRFHAVADSVAVLASEVPLTRAAADVPAAEALPPLAEQAARRLAEAVGALPLVRAGQPYNAEALADGARQDAPWHQVRVLLRLSRYAQEVLVPEYADPRLTEAALLLEGHRDAAEAAAAAAAAARTPRIAPATAYALGVLHADQRHQVEAARYAFGRVWLSREKALKGVER